MCSRPFMPYKPSWKVNSHPSTSRAWEASTRVIEAEAWASTAYGVISKATGVSVLTLRNKRRLFHVRQRRGRCHHLCPQTPGLGGPAKYIGFFEKKKSNFVPPYFSVSKILKPDRRWPFSTFPNHQNPDDDPIPRAPSRRLCSPRLLLQRSPV